MDSVITEMNKIRKSGKGSHVRTVAASDALFSAVSSQPGAPQTPTSFFAAACRALGDGAPRGPLFRSLAIVLPHVPPAVVVQHFAGVASMVREPPSSGGKTTKKKFSNSSVSCSRSAIAVALSTPLASFPDWIRLTISFVSSVAISSFGSSNKVHRTAHLALSSLLRLPDASSSAFVAKYVVEYVAKALKEKETEEAAAAVLEKIASCLPNKTRPAVIPLLLACVARNAARAASSRPASSIAMRALGGLSGVLDDCSDPSIASAVVRGCVALTTVGPDCVEVFATHAALLSLSMSVLHRIDPSSSGDLLPSAVALLAPGLMYAGSCADAACQSLREILRSTVDQALVESAHTTSSPLGSVIATVSELLAFRNRASWELSFGVMASLFRAVGRQSPRLLAPQLLALVGLHDLPEFDLQPQLESTLGSIVEAIGAQQFLSVVHLDLDAPIGAAAAATAGSDRVNRDWLLPVLRAHVRDAPLSLFVSEFLPIANKLAEMSEQSKKDGRVVEAKNEWHRCLQIWDLFPAFCRTPASVATEFKKIAQTLGTRVKEPDFRNAVCSGLETLIGSCHKSEETVDSTDEAKKQAKEAVSVISSFSKNFLPCLFNTMSATEQSQRAPVIAAIDAYLSVSPAPVSNAFFREIVNQITASTKATSAGEKPVTSAAASEVAERITTLADLAIPFASHLDAESAQTLFDVVTPLLTAENTTVQKRAWKVLNSMCSQAATVTQSHRALGQLIVEKVPAQCVRRVWLKCVSSLATVAQKSGLENWLTASFTVATLPPIIMGMKDCNSRTRTASFRALLEVGQAFASSCAGPRAGSSGVSGMESFANTVVAGLGAKSPRMISGTVVALARILFDFPNLLSDGFTKNLLEAATMLLHAEAPEIIRSVLQLVKVALSVIPFSKFEPHVAEILKNLIEWTKAHPKHVRKQSRHLFERLMRKLGFAKICRLVPEETKKILRNIRKTKLRKKKQKLALRRKNEEMDAPEETPKTKEAKKKKKPTFEQTLDLSDLDTSDEEEEAEEEGEEQERGREETVPAGKRQRVDGSKGEDDDLEEDFDDDEEEMLDADDGLPAGKRRRASDDTDEPLDLLDPAMVSKHQQSPVPTKKRKPEPNVVFNAEGKIVIEDEAAAQSTVPAAGELSLDKEGDDEEEDDDEEEEAPTKKGKGDATSSLAVRGRSEMYQRMIARRQKLDEQRRKKRTPEVHSGEAFKGKGGGDIKRGDIDPYAYIPLNPRNLKKGNRTEQYMGIVGAARKGSRDGAIKFSRNRRKKH